MNSNNISLFKSGTLTLLACISLLTISNNSNSQVVAQFQMDDSLVCTPQVVQFTNTGSSGVNYSYKWYFGSIGTSILENPTFEFNSPGTIPVSFVITNNLDLLDKDSVVHIVVSTLTPSADLDIDASNACVRGKINFQAGFSTRDSARWDFGDGNTFLSFSSYMSHIYNANGNYTVSYSTYYRECWDTSHYEITIDGPTAEITVNPSDACKGSPVQISMTPVGVVTSHSWNLGEGDIQTGNPVTHTYETRGYNTILLYLSGPSGDCEIEDTVHIYEVEAKFEVADTSLCHQKLVLFDNTSTGNIHNSWDFGNGSYSLAEDGTTFYNAGNYDVTLRIDNNECADSITKSILINELPTISIIDDQITCPGDQVQLSVEGGNSVEWYPVEAFNNPYSYTPTVSPESTSIYVATITDTATHCRNSDNVMVTVQAGFIQGKIVLIPAEIDTLIIGETDTVIVYDTLGRALSYVWTPETGISCTDCSEPVFQPLETTTYTLVVSDTNQCFSSETFEVTIPVKVAYTIGVPAAFTPNGDEINSTIKVDGWGIKRLISFSVYNRWNKLVFRTDDINQGWDGYYNGNLQNTDTYSYIIIAEMWDGNQTTVKGTFSLLR